MSGFTPLLGPRRRHRRRRRCTLRPRGRSSEGLVLRQRPGDEDSVRAEDTLPSRPSGFCPRGKAHSTGEHREAKGLEQEVVAEEGESDMTKSKRGPLAKPRYRAFADRWEIKVDGRYVPILD